MRTGESVVWNETREYWDPNSNIYSVDLTELMLGHAIGDPLNVTATKGDLIGWTEAHVSDNGYTQIDVILSQMVGVKMVTITLTVTDMMGRSASVSHTVKLSLAPIAEFTLTMTGLTVIVDASSSTSAYGIVSYDWDWGDGTSGTGLTASHTYSLNGSMPASSELTTLGRSRPPPPHAVFGFTYQSDGVTPLPGCIVTVTNVRTGETLVWDENREYWDPNSNVYSLDLSWMVNYGFRIGDILNVTATKGAFIGCTIAPVTDSPNGYDQIDVVLYDSSLPHEFIITLTVTDTLGRNGSVSMQVMLDIPKLPIAIIHYATDYLNVTFDGGSSYDPDGTIVQYTWDFGDGSLATGWKAFHTYAARGTYTIKLTVVDNDGLIGTISSNVYVFSPPPPPGYAPTAVFSYTLYKNEISVDASESYDIDGEIVSYYWTIGDEASMLGETAYYRFSSGGTFVVTLIVTDNEGVSGSASTTPGAWSVVGVQEPDHVFLL
jgi:PKD repeat protein